MKRENIYLCGLIHKCINVILKADKKINRYLVKSNHFYNQLCDAVFLQTKYSS